MKGQTYVVFAIVFIIIISIFAVTNVSPVKVNYLFWTAESPLILVILFSVLMGVLITATVGMVKVFRLQRDIKIQRTENQKLHRTLLDNGLEAESINEQTNKE
ncbi:lipopolysaccharide assembly protein LapA domain-containing protein [Virgibacillus sp. LDC-1]|uniref:LapA family protein n=1 Tax=Virgibacillus sp. LDC-1 TaxID=3039856 RepID=UPI0024DE4C11|nr:lipopolysaccharide assembly protein LapA domain-containing protein [Virgibacillus sp. LDC-1]